MITFEQLKKAFEEIGWSLKDVGCDIYSITDHKRRRTNFQVWKGTTEKRIELRKMGQFGLYMNLDSCYLKILDGNCVSIGPMRNKRVFLQFYNHDKKVELNAKKQQGKAKKKKKGE